jgi:hypothetical protein
MTRRALYAPAAAEAQAHTHMERIRGRAYGGTPPRESAQSLFISAAFCLVPVGLK